MTLTREQINDTRLGKKKYMLPVGTQAHEVLTIDKDYWNKINYRINKRKLDAEKIQNNIERDNKIRELSKNLWKDWQNTVMGARQKKLQQRQDRLNRIENERQRIDKEEAEFQAVSRKAAIEKARTMQYYQNDRLKKFHSALILSEAEKERDIQCEINKTKLKDLKQSEKEEYFRIKEAYEQELEREKEKQRKIREKNIEFAKHNQDVYEHQLQARIEAKSNDLAEVERVRNKIQECAQEEINRKNIMKNWIKEDSLQAIENNKKTKEAKMLLNEEEDDKIRMFAAGKTLMARKVMAKQAEIFNEKQDHLEAVKEIVIQSAHLVDLKDKEFLHRSIKAGEAKFLAEEEAKVRHNEKAQKEITKHRLYTIKCHEEQQVEAKKEDIEEGKRKLEAYKQYLTIEEKKRKKMRERALSLVDYWDIQKGVLQRNKDRVNNFKGKHVKDLTKLSQIEEEVFKSYTGEIIDHCRQGERNLQPLLKQANKKSY